MAKLIINPTSGAKKEIPVAGKIVSIGRDPSNDLVLSDAMVSRRHAILERRGEQYVLRDNSSSNGTMVNGDRVLTEQTLNDGDLIAIGSARLLFNVEGAVATPAPPSPGALATQPMPIRPVPSGPATVSAAARAGLSCLSCGVQASPFDQFCRQCGEKLPDSSVKQVSCKSCHAVVMLPAKFCGSCGKLLLSEAPRHTESPESEASSPSPVPSPSRAAAEAPAARPGIVSPNTPPPGPSADARMSGARSAAGGAVTSALSKVSGSPSPRVESDRAPSPISRAKSTPRLADRPSARPRAMGEPAGFWIRLAAYAIDTAIVSLPALVASSAWAFWLLQQGGEMAIAEFTPRVFLLPILGGAASLVLSIVYPVYFWALRGATPGKQVFGLRVLGMDGETPIGWQRAMMRVIGYMINGLVIGIGFLWIAVSEEKRGLHDRLAGTMVLRRS